MIIIKIIIVLLYCFNIKLIIVLFENNYFIIKNEFNLKSHKKLDPREYFLFNKRDVSSSFFFLRIFPSGA